MPHRRCVVLRATFRAVCCLCFGVADSIEGKEQHASFELVAPPVYPVIRLGAFGIVLLNQVEEGLLGWRCHFLR